MQLKIQSGCMSAIALEIADSEVQSNSFTTTILGTPKWWSFLTVGRFYSKIVVSSGLTDFERIQMSIVFV
jgi:hypothetical protein